MKVSKSSGGGAWLDKKTLRDGDMAKLVTEAQDVEGQNGMQLVAKIKIKGGDPEPKNLAINAPSKNALIDAFGDDTQGWMEKLLTLHTEKTLIAGKRGIAVYLIPEGYEVGEDAGGYLVIGKAGTVPKEIASHEREMSQDDVDAIPF